MAAHPLLVSCLYWPECVRCKDRVSKIGDQTFSRRIKKAESSQTHNLNTLDCGQEQGLALGQLGRDKDPGHRLDQESQLCPGRVPRLKSEAPGKLLGLLVISYFLDIYLFPLHSSIIQTFDNKRMYTSNLQTLIDHSRLQAFAHFLPIPSTYP